MTNETCKNRCQFTNQLRYWGTMRETNNRGSVRCWLCPTTLPKAIRRPQAAEEDSGISEGIFKGAIWP